MASECRACKRARSCLKPTVSTLARLWAMVSRRVVWALAPSAETYRPYGTRRSPGQSRAPPRELGPAAIELEPPASTIFDQSRGGLEQIAAFPGRSGVAGGWQTGGWV